VLFKIAEMIDFGNGDDRRAMQDVVNNTAAAVNGQYDTTGPRVIGSVKWIGNDPTVSGDRYEVEFEIEWGGDYMNPDTAIEATEMVQSEYNERVEEKTGVVFV